MKKFIINLALVGVSIAAISPTHATVGGDQWLEFLGYEPKEQKVYVFRHFEDGRGRLPQLYYYHLKSATPNKLVMVNSLYKNPKNGKIDYMPPDDSQFNQQIAKIKKRLQPLQKLSTSAVKLNALSQQQKMVTAWYDQYNDSKLASQKDKVIQYRYRYQLQSDARLAKSGVSQKFSSQSFISQPQTAISYAKGLTVNQAFLLPKQQKILASIKYLGDNFETGYAFEDTVMLEKR